MSELVTVAEAAAILGLSYQRVDGLVREGRLEVVDHVGHVRRLRRAAIEAFATVERRRGPRPKEREMEPYEARPFQVEEFGYSFVVRDLRDDSIVRDRDDSSSLPLSWGAHAEAEACARRWNGCPRHRVPKVDDWHPGYGSDRGAARLDARRRCPVCQIEELERLLAGAAAGGPQNEESEEWERELVRWRNLLIGGEAK